MFEGKRMFFHTLNIFISRSIFFFHTDGWFQLYTLLQVFEISQNLFGSCGKYIQEQNLLCCIKNLIDLYKYTKLFNWECKIFSLVLSQNFFFLRGTDYDVDAYKWSMQSFLIQSLYQRKDSRGSPFHSFLQWEKLLYKDNKSISINM